MLKFTPLEFETFPAGARAGLLKVKIYSVGVWNLFGVLEILQMLYVKIYSVGVWNKL